MENGLVILGIIALLFLSMYGYAYLSTAMVKVKLKREAKKIEEKEHLMRQERIKKQEIINEKVRKFSKRREEIKHELMLLEKMKMKQKVS